MKVYSRNVGNRLSRVTNWFTKETNGFCLCNNTEHLYLCKTCNLLVSEFRPSYLKLSKPCQPSNLGVDIKSCHPKENEGVQTNDKQ